nr:MAG TPA: hypothetical protein [Caudoviricetes sp.]
MFEECIGTFPSLACVHVACPTLLKQCGRPHLFITN